MSESSSLTAASGLSPALRRGVYWLLIAVAIGQVTGRLLAVNSVDRMLYESTRINEELAKTRANLMAAGIEDAALDEKLRRRRAELEKRLASQRPFLSGNDRSRWLTVRSLVEYGTYAIDPIVTDPDQARIWDTIDMVKHVDRNGAERLYSSKPPLLATIVAGPYWLLHRTTGLSLRDDTHVVVRMLLLLINVLPLLLYLILLAALLERYGSTDFGRLLVMSLAAFGTFITTFAVVFNNHVVAAFCVMAALYAGLRIWYDGRREWRYFAVAGLFAALAAATELPALSFFAIMGVGLCYRAWKPTLLAFAPAAVLVGIASVGTNYLAHHTIYPPYGFRTPGKDFRSGNWYEFTYKISDKEHRSYWSYDPAAMKRRSPVDLGEPSRARYALHSLIGHHGIFSLTPAWLLSVVGLGMMLRGGPGSLRPWGILVAVLSLVCIAFYLGQGQENRNYGGMTSGLRWSFWLVPLWLFAMIPAADWIARNRWSRGLAAALLAFSVFSASYPVWNPWTHPWPARLMIYLGWIRL